MRSDCPVNFAVEILGDKWSLVIMRDILFWGKRTYGDLLNRDEGIATNILAARLEYLEEQGLILRRPDPNDRRKEIFEATEFFHDACSSMRDPCRPSNRNGRLRSGVVFLRWGES